MPTKWTSVDFCVGDDDEGAAPSSIGSNVATHGLQTVSIDDNERWARVENFDYEVSTQGRVRRIGGAVLTTRSSARSVTETVNLSSSTLGSSRRSVARIVLEAFSGASEMNVVFLDKDSRNLHISNLQWGTTRALKHARPRTIVEWEELFEWESTNAGSPARPVVDSWTCESESATDDQTVAIQGPLPEREVFSVGVMAADDDTPELWADYRNTGCAVSTLGRVRGSADLKLRNTQPTSDGYRQLTMWPTTRASITRRIGRMVAETFCGAGGDREVDHINRDQADDRLSNLRWTTRLGNIQNRQCAVMQSNKRRRVERVDKDGNAVVFDSVRDAAEATPGMTIGNLQNTLYTKRASLGYEWSYAPTCVPEASVLKANFAALNAFYALRGKDPIVVPDVDGDSGIDVSRDGLLVRDRRRWLFRKKEKNCNYEEQIKEAPWRLVADLYKRNNKPSITVDHKVVNARRLVEATLAAADGVPYGPSLTSMNKIRKH